MSHRIALEPLRMTDKALWSRSLALLDRLDLDSLSYDPGQLRHNAAELRDVLLELRKRGVQLSLLPPAP